MVPWVLPGNRSDKASVEARIAGIVTPEILAALCLYGLTSAHMTVKAMKSRVNVIFEKKYYILSRAVVMITTAGRIAHIARIHPDTVL